MGFPQTNKIENIGIIANFVDLLRIPYIGSSSLFAPCNGSKCKIICQWVQDFKVVDFFG